MATPMAQAAEQQLNLRTLTWGGLTWIDIVEPTKEATQYLAERFNFHPLDLEDCISRRQISKIDIYADYLFVIFHLPVYDKKTRKSTRKQWSAFIGDNYLVTLRPGELKSLDALFRLCELNPKAREQYMGNGSGYLFYSILDRAVDSYFPVLNAIARQIDDIEDAVFDEETEVGKELALLRQDIMAQRRVMFPTRNLLRQLETRLGRFSKMDLSVYFGDLMDHMDKICDTLDEFSEVINVFKDADYYLSGYRANHVIRALFILLTTISPFLVVTGLYSMHIYLSRSADGGSPMTFFTLLALMVVIAGGLLYCFRRRRLI